MVMVGIDIKPGGLAATTQIPQAQPDEGEGDGQPYPAAGCENPIENLHTTIRLLERSLHECSEQPVGAASAAVFTHYTNGG